MDIEEIRQIVTTQLQNQESQINNTSSFMSRDESNMTIINMIFNNFTARMELVDPMDRSLPSNENKQSISIDTLFKRI